MNESRFYREPHPPARRMPELIQQVLATTDIPSLVATVADAYRLTVTLERDIKAIEADHSLRMADLNKEHEQIMQALEMGFKDQHDEFAAIERMANVMMENGQFELAHATIGHFLTLRAGKSGPTEKAFARRQLR